MRNGTEQEKPMVNFTKMFHDVAYEIRNLIARVEHIGERIKTEDVYQRQMELALQIHRLCSKQKLQYLKVGKA